MLRLGLFAFRLVLTGWLILVASAAAQAATVVSGATADFDRWMYPFNAFPGFRANASTFSSYPDPDFDNMDGQFLVGFNTSAVGVPTSVPAGYARVIDAVSVSVTHYIGAFTYDNTFDPYQSYLEPGDPNLVADSDAGRPIELYGVGLRNGFSGLSFGGPAIGTPLFEQTELFGPGGKGNRNAYAYDPVVGDVSNVLTNQQFTASPFAIGQTNLTPGAAVVQGVPNVSAGSTFAFDVDLTRPDIVAYLQNGLSGGGLFFSVVSLHSASLGGPSAYPNFYTSDATDPAAIAPSLDMTYEVLRLGDANRDGAVTTADYTIWANHFDQSPASWDDGDFNQDGIVTTADYTIWANHFDFSPGPLPLAVPEPSTWLLAALGAVALLVRRLRR